MCRFLIYKGAPIKLSTVLTLPEHSLVSQSCRSPTRIRCFTPGAKTSDLFDSWQHKIRNNRLNGDGFGVGFYSSTEGSPHTDTTPTLFRSTLPMWSNQNLREMVGAKGSVSGAGRCNVVFACLYLPCTLV